MLTQELATSIDSPTENPTSMPVCEVIRTRDHFLVHRTFVSMTPEARTFLWNWLDPRSKYKSGETPTL